MRKQKWLYQKQIRNFVKRVQYYCLCLSTYPAMICCNIFNLLSFLAYSADDAVKKNTPSICRQLCHQQVLRSLLLSFIQQAMLACLLGLIRCLFLLWVSYLYLPVIILVLLYLVELIMSQIISALVHKYLSQKFEITYLS